MADRLGRPRTTVGYAQRRTVKLLQRAFGVAVTAEQRAKPTPDVSAIDGRLDAVVIAA